MGTAGPCCGGRWVAGYPCAPVHGGEDGALARRPQAPLDRDGQPSGQPLSRYYLRRVYLNSVAQARTSGQLATLDLHGPHDLRHTFATWLEDAGIPARVIDSRLAVALRAVDAAA